MTDSIYDLVGAEVPARLKSQNVERVFCNMDTDKDGVISLEAGENILQFIKILMKIFGSVKEPKESLCLSVRLSGTKCSKALNLHLSLIGQFQVSLRSVPGKS